MELAGRHLRQAGLEGRIPFSVLPLQEVNLKEEDGVLKPDREETVRLCGMLRDSGVSIINLSASQPPQRLFGEAPDETARPFTEVSDMLAAVRQIRSRTPGVRFVCSGLSQFRQFGPAVGSGGIRDGWFDFAGFGRQALAFPDFARAALAGEMPQAGRCCILCNSCYRMMVPEYPAVGCVVRDPDPFAEFYRHPGR